MKKKALGCFMAKRLTKALREKRRWVGVMVDSSCQHREDVERHLNAMTSSLDSEPNIRLMDWWPPERRASLGEPTPLTVDHPHVGLAVIRIHLKDAHLLRGMLESGSAFEQYGLQSLTTSGKIRLVRERMGLPRPKRHTQK
tara:strand:+ start:1131 stop:1553 length:423 start_codon:yes stop_codon:yes gene_type:complete